MNTLLLIAAVVVVLALAGYAVYLWRQVFLQQKQQAAAELEIAEREREAEKVARESIEIVLRALEQEQVSLTEASIRITSYVRALPEAEHSSDFYQPFISLAQATAHIPILDAWRKLDRKEQLKFDLERAALEEKHEAAIQQMTKALLLSYPVH